MATFDLGFAPRDFQGERSVSHLSYASLKPFPNFLLLHQLPSLDPTSTNPQSGAATRQM